MKATQAQLFPRGAKLPLFKILGNQDIGYCLSLETV